MLINDGKNIQPEHQAIGVFDSGVGGLSVLAHIRARLPDERFIYVADSNFMPYGCKSDALVQERCLSIAAFFAEQSCKALVVACNTATAIAIHRLRERYAWPVIGMEPAVKPAVRHSQTGVVGILATSGTINSHKFNRLRQRVAGDTRLIVQPCPGLVELIEQGELNSPAIRLMLQACLRPLMQQNVDTLVLGCTHYPFVGALIREIVGEHMTIVDSGAAIARELQRQLLERGLLSKQYTSAQMGGEGFWSSGDIQRVEPLMSRLWGEVVVLKKLPF